MTRELRALDHALFHRLNVVWTARVLDAALPVLTDLNRSRWFWVAVVSLIAVWIWRERARALRLAVALGATIAASDVFCYRVIKPLVHRLRPEYVLPDVVLRAGSHGRYGFPSNHAANTFAAAMLLSAFYPRLTASAFLIAALVGYSRVYVGAHFPLDVLGGAAIGCAIGALAVLVCRKTRFIDDRKP